MSPKLFPEDRFCSLLPESERFAASLQKSLRKTAHVPQTAKEFGARPVLHQFLPAWDVQAYARMAQIALHVHNSNNPTYEATGALPQLSDGNFLVPEHDILRHLQTFYADLDHELSPQQQSESYAFRVMISEQLHRILVRTMGNPTKMSMD